MTQLTPESAAAATAQLALMAFFPNDPDTRIAMAEVLIEMVDTEEHLNWLVRRALQVYSRWPGIAELRALYCSRFKPRDGIETYSEVYGEGFPPDRL